MKSSLASHPVLYYFSLPFLIFQTDSPEFQLLIEQRFIVNYSYHRQIGFIYWCAFNIIIKLIQYGLICFYFNHWPLRDMLPALLIIPSLEWLQSSLVWTISFHMWLNWDGQKMSCKITIISFDSTIFYEKYKNNIRILCSSIKPTPWSD